jgi:hypothetical protein
MGIRRAVLKTDS